MERRNSSSSVWAVILGIVLAFGTLTQAQGDPFAGTWVLNIDKSQFTTGGAAVRSRTLTITPKSDAFTHAQDTYRVGQDAIVKVTFDAKYDGSEATVSGAAFSTVSFTRMGRTLVRKAKDVGMEVETATYTLSADGKTMTVVTTGNNRGIMYGSTQVFEKK
jgi:hypothetical protein